MNKIRTFCLSKLSAGDCCSFHQRVLELIANATPQALHLEHQVAEYTALVDKLQQLVACPRAYVGTHLLKQADRQRDAFVGVIQTTVRSHLTNPIPAKRQAARRLSPQLAPYRGLRAHKYYQQTAEIESLVALLAQQRNVADIARLALTDEVQGLAQANAQFEQAQAARTAEKRARLSIRSVNVRQAKQAVNHKYAHICKIAEVMALTETSTVAHDFILSLSAHVKDYADTLSTP